MSRFSRRTAHDPTPNRWARLCEALPTRYDLTLSNPTRAGLPYDAEAIAAALAHPAALSYAPHPFGSPTARAAVAGALGVDPARVVLTASTSEAYGWLFKLLCDPGDDVLAPSPSYPLFDHLATFEGVALRPYRLRYTGAWEVDAATLVPGPRTRAALIVSPNNPTGNYLHAADLAALRALDLPLICDEVFAPYALRRADADRAPTLARLDAGLAFVLGGLSKWAGLPQMKLGWIVVAGAARAAAEALERLELIADTYLSVGAPVQQAAAALLAGPTQAAIAQRTQRNLAALRSAVAGTGAEVPRVEGGWYALLRLPAVQDDEAWALRFLRDAGVRVQPGWFYDLEGGPYVVISLLPRAADFVAGVEALLALV